MIAFKVDLSKYKRAIAVLGKITPDAMAAAVQSVSFVRQSQVYLSREMVNAMREGGELQEGQTAEIRGQVWHGWARWMRRAYGESVQEGTRYRYRKYRRGGAKVKTASTRLATLRGIEWKSAKQWREQDKLAALVRRMKATRRGTVSSRARRESEGRSVRERPWERVWRLRASGKPYSASAKIMQDTGRLRQGLLTLRTMLGGSSRRPHVEYRPGAMVTYFDRQNELRPVFVLDPKADEKPIARFFFDALRQVLMAMVVR